MAYFEISGKTSLNGALKVGGAKNEALKLISLAVLVDGELVIENVPKIKDVMTQLDIFQSLGGKYSFENSKLILDSSQINKTEIPPELSGKLRASLVYAGSLLARFGKVSISCPGGCVIGERPIDTHLDAFRQAGAEVDDKDSSFELRNVQDSNSSIEITMNKKSVTATENIILYLCTGKRKCVLHNMAIEPEIMHLIKCINELGGKIEYLGESSIEIDGVDHLSARPITVIPDRIEAGTFVIAMVATGGTGEVFPYPADDLSALSDILRSSGVNIKIEGDRAIIGKSDKITPFEIETAPHPGFPTDLQSPMSLIASVAQGESVIRENIFENRFGYIKELKSMGVNAEIVNEHEAKITGPTNFVPATIDSLDLRSGITLLIAAMMAEGKTILKNAEIIDRGYENIENRLNEAGAKILRKE